MKRKLYYAVDGIGQGRIFTTPPVRDEKRKAWIGDMLVGYTMALAQLESEGFLLPPLKWSDEPKSITLEITIE